MLYKLVYYIFKLFPRTKQYFWKKWYTIFTNKVSNHELKFMNYGYFRGSKFNTFYSTYKLISYIFH